MMDTWVVMARALLAVEVLQRRWARELGLDGGAAFVVLVLRHNAMSCASIAVECGRQRQHVQRTLRTLEASGLVEVSSRAADGRVNTWRLSGDGEEVARRLDARSRAWAQMLEPAGLRELERGLVRLTAALVNRPLNNGWAHALSEPFEVRNLCWDSLPSREPWRAVSEPGAKRALAPRLRGEHGEPDATGSPEVEWFAPE